jgi:hypothetical protein
MSSYYEKYKNEIVDCVYCNSRINLHYVNNHLKSSKKCNKLKLLYLNSNPDIKESDFVLYLNKLKKQLKYDELLVDEN